MPLTELETLECLESKSRDLRVKLAANTWELAGILQELRASGVWKLRTAYTNFGSYTRAELQLSGKYVRALIRMRELFTKEDVQDIGPSKLQVLLTFEENRIPMMLTVLRMTGMSRRELERLRGWSTH